MESLTKDDFVPIGCSLLSFSIGSFEKKRIKRRSFTPKESRNLKAGFTWKWVLITWLDFLISRLNNILYARCVGREGECAGRAEMGESCHCCNKLGK